MYLNIFHAAAKKNGYWLPLLYQTRQCSQWRFFHSVLWWWYDTMILASQRPFSFNSQNHSILFTFLWAFSPVNLLEKRGWRQGRNIMWDTSCELFCIFYLFTRYSIPKFFTPFLPTRRTEKNRSVAVSSSFQSTFIIIFACYFVFLYIFYI